MKNWKTTLTGVLGAILYAIFPLFQGGQVAPKDLIIAAAVAGIGALSKDFNVTGGTVMQTPSA
jgi:hypothetical protein